MSILVSKVLSFCLTSWLIGLTTIAPTTTELPEFVRSSMSVFDQGVIATQTGDFATALQAFTQAIQDNDHPASAYANRCLIEVQVNQYEAAIEDCTQAIRLQPSNWEAFLNRGLAQYYSGQLQPAILDNTHLLEARPQDWRAYNNRGLALAALNDHKAAIPDYNRALVTIPPSEPTALSQIFLNKGISLAKLQNTSAAVLQFNQAIRLDAFNDLAYFNRGCVHGRQQEYQLAIQDFDHALWLNPDIPKARLDRAIAYYHLGQSSKALTDLQDAALAFNQQGNHSEYQKTQQLIEQIQDSYRLEFHIG